jgi:hypothetical protein
MTERERLAADVRRLAWLADATLGPERIGCAATPPPASGPLRPSLPIGLWRHGMSSARVLGGRIRLLHPSTGEALVRRAPGPVL